MAIKYGDLWKVYAALHSIREGSSGDVVRICKMRREKVLKCLDLLTRGDIIMWSELPSNRGRPRRIFKVVETFPPSASTAIRSLVVEESPCAIMADPDKEVTAQEFGRSVSDVEKATLAIEALTEAIQDLTRVMVELSEDAPD